MENKAKKIVIKSLNISLPILAVVLFLPSIMQLTKASTSNATNELESNLKSDKEDSLRDAPRYNQYYEMYGEGNGSDLSRVNVNAYTNGKEEQGKSQYGVWNVPWYNAELYWYPAILQINSESGGLLNGKSNIQFTRMPGDSEPFETPEEGAQYIASNYSIEDNGYAYNSKTWDGEYYAFTLEDTPKPEGPGAMFFFSNLWLPLADEEYSSDELMALTGNDHDIKDWFKPENITLKYGTEYWFTYQDNHNYDSYVKNHPHFETPTLLDLQLKDPETLATTDTANIKIPYTTGVEDKKADGTDWNTRDAYTLAPEYWDLKFNLSGTDFSLANVEVSQDTENNNFVITAKGLEPGKTYDDWKITGIQYWNGVEEVTLPDFEFGNVQVEKLPADVATLDGWSYESTKHTATIDYKLNVPQGDSTKEDSFASKIEIVDSDNKVIASDESDGTTSLGEGTMLVDKTAAGEPLAADNTFDWTMRVYGDRYDDTKYTDTEIKVLTKPLNVSKGPKFDTLEASWTDITKHSATLNYSFDTDFNKDNNTSYMDNENSTIVGATVTTDDESLSITVTPSAVTTTNNDFDEHGNGTQTHTGTVKIEGLEPKQTYNNLGLAVDWKSDSWTEAKTSTTELPELNTENWDVPAAPTVTLSEDEALKNPEGFTVEGTFDATKYDDYNQLPTNIDSINLMYAMKGDEGNPIQEITKTFDEETNIWTGRYAFSGLKAETEYSVWTEVTYSAQGSEDFNDQKITSDKITVTTGSYDENVLISDFNWTADTTKPSTGQFDIKVTSGHEGDNWYNPVFDPETIVVKDKDGNKLNVSNVTSGKTEGTYTFALTELQGGQTYDGVKISLENSNEIEASFTTADLLAPKAPIIEAPTVSSITQTSADIKYSFTAESGDSKDYLPTNVEKVELIDSTTSKTLLTADDTNESGTFKLTGLDIQKEYKVKVKLTYSGELTVESNEVTFSTANYNPAQAPIISQLEWNNDHSTPPTIKAHYKIEVPNEPGYDETKIISITAKLNDANDQTIDSTQLEGDIEFKDISYEANYKLNLIVEWSGSDYEVQTVNKEIELQPGVATINSASIEMNQNIATINWDINDGYIENVATADTVSKITVSSDSGSVELGTELVGTKTIELPEGTFYDNVEIIVETEGNEKPLVQLLEEQIVSPDLKVDFSESTVEGFKTNDNGFEFSLTAKGYNEELADTIQVMNGDTPLNTKLKSSSVNPTRSTLETTYTYEVTDLEPGTDYSDLSITSTDESITMPDGGISVPPFTIPDPEGKEGLSMGVMIGIAVGILLVITIPLVITFVVLKKKKSKE